MLKHIHTLIVDMTMTSPYISVRHASASGHLIQN